MAKQQKFKIKVSKQYSKAERLAIGLDIVDFIQRRSKSGKDKHGVRFPAYSKEYKDSFDFKLAGKGVKPNLTLSGEMLNAIEVLAWDNTGELLIGIPENDSYNNEKAEGNILGSYGGSPSITKARDFMGINSSDLKKVLANHSISTEAEAEANRSKANELLNAHLIASSFAEGLDE